jgi:hypothetical protein
VSSSLSPEPAATSGITRRSGYGNSTADEKTSAYPTAHDHAQTHHSHPHPALPPIQSTDADSHPEDFSTTPGSSGSVTPLGTGTGTSSAISTPASPDVVHGDVSKLDFEQNHGHEHGHEHEHEHHHHHQHHAHGPKPGDRDHPETIKRRMRAVGLATAGSILGVWIVVKHVGGYTARQSVRGWQNHRIEIFEIIGSICSVCRLEDGAGHRTRRHIPVHRRHPRRTALSI